MLHGLLQPAGRCKQPPSQRDSAAFRADNLLSGEPPCTLCNQMVFLGIMQTNGGARVSHLLILPSPRCKGGQPVLPRREKVIESFIFGVTRPQDGATQAPYFHITLDWTVRTTCRTSPPSSAARKCLHLTATADRVDMVNKAFIEIMIEGTRRRASSPDSTYSITKDFDWLTRKQQPAVSI